MKKLLLVFICLVFLAGGAFFFFSSSPKKIEYLTETVRRGDIQKTVKATGDITASLLVDVGVQVTGQVKKLHVHLGQQVHRGDLIAEIDATRQTNDLNTARAKLTSLEAQLASKIITQDMAKRNYNREKKLFAIDSTSEKELETAKDRLAIANSAITEIRSSIKQARIAVSTAEADLAYTRITAPISGTIVAAAIREGQTVNSVQSSPTIVQIADLSSMLIRMQIAEGDITKIRSGMRVVFSTLANPDLKREATLQSIDPGLTVMSQGNYTSRTDPTNEAIYYYGRAITDNPDGKLHIGMTTENTIFVDQAQDVLILPTVVIRQDKPGNGTVQVLLDNGKVETRQIRIGLADEMNTEILSGLREGEKVISSQSDGTIIDTKSPGMRPRRKR